MMRLGPSSRGRPGIKMTSDLTILIAEDDPSDAELLKAAMKRVGLSNTVRVVENGERAIAYLEGRAPYDDRATFPMPSLMITDLKMPMIGGFEVLEWIRNRGLAGAAPVIVLSGSALRDDVEKAYRLGASSYIAKPDGFDGWVEMVKLVAGYWGMCEKPGGRAEASGRT